jgi:hypothetical protein
MSAESHDVSSRERDVFGEPPDLAPMDDRILAAYRREIGSSQGLWQRSLRIPLPLVALLLVGLFVCAALVSRERSSGRATGRSSPAVQAVRYDPPVVTNTSLAGFEPVDDMQPIDVGRSRP